MTRRFPAFALRRCLTLLLCAALAGCASQPRVPYTAAEAATAQPAGYEHVRVWLDATGDNPNGFGPVRVAGKSSKYLALSGGGGNGAYGAGLLNGWTQSGRRPVFDAVSGVSTGALIAPFAFLGASHDGVLREIYTGGQAASLVAAPNVATVAFGSSLFGGSHLLDLVSRYVDAGVVQAIAREHAAGRRLYVVTTNVDAKRGVVWNIGAIAASGRPDAVDLIRKVLAASASVPLAFAPQLIDVAADGRPFQEMHVDGNVTTAVFTLPLKLLAGQNRTGLSGGSIFIIMNTDVQPRFGVVENATLPIVSASIETLTTQKAEEDLAAMYAYAKANHVDFNLTAVDPSVEQGGLGSFDTAYMRKLFDLGLATGQTGTFWRKSPIANAAPTRAAAPDATYRSASAR